MIGIIRRNLESIKQKIEEACLKVGRDPNEVLIVGATKDQPIEKIRIAYDLGIRVFGENRVQEAVKKIEETKEFTEIEWHMIGHLQRNKVKQAISMFKMIQSVENILLVEELVKRLKNSGKSMKILIEVNTSMESTKFGLPPDEDVLKNFIDRILTQSDVLELMGLMTLGPYPPEEIASRRSFSMLRTLKERMENYFGIRLPILSMGMSDDFYWACLEGSTMVRIGRALFGPRGDGDTSQEK